MLGYYKDPEATAEVLDAEGWFHTGDLARVDEDGYYFLTGRKKNVIILGSGDNASREELEKLLGSIVYEGQSDCYRALKRLCVAFHRDKDRDHRADDQPV